MSNPTLNFRYVGSQTFGSGTVASCADAIYTLGIKTTFDEGDARTPGSGSAWTWSRYQNAGTTEAVYAAPPTDTLTQRVIIAGQASGGTKTPSMASWDTSTTVMLMMGINKNSGAFNAWDNAAPFTSGQWSGYSRLWPGSAGAGIVYLYESQETIVVVIANASGGVYIGTAGAIADPETSDTTLAAESDGKLYGMAVSGSGAVASTTFWTGGTYAIFQHAATNGREHCYVFTPGSAVLKSAALFQRFLTSSSTTATKNAAGEYARLGVSLRFTASAPLDLFCGRVREVFMFSNHITPGKQGTTGYIVAASTASAADAMYLQR